MKITNENYIQFSLFVIFLVFISSSIAYSISIFLSYSQVDIPFYIDLPISAPALFALFFYIFDKYLWKEKHFHKFFKKTGIIIADDLNGKWKGIVKSSYDNFKKDITAELDIQQTATQVTIRAKFNESKSISVHESFGKNEIDDCFSLYYFFRNHPNSEAIETMAMHEGSAILSYNQEDDELVGHYYSGRNRNNHGTISVKRVK